MRCCASTCLETEEIHETTQDLSSPARDLKPEPHEYKEHVLAVENEAHYRVFINVERPQYRVFMNMKTSQYKVSMYVVGNQYGMNIHMNMKSIVQGVYKWG